MIANMIEIHANATPFDAGVYLSSCDKGLPGNLMGLARVEHSGYCRSGRNDECGTGAAYIRAAWHVQRKI